MTAGGPILKSNPIFSGGGDALNMTGQRGGSITHISQLTPSQPLTGDDPRYQNNLLPGMMQSTPVNQKEVESREALFPHDIHNLLGF